MRQANIEYLQQTAKRLDMKAEHHRAQVKQHMEDAAKADEQKEKLLAAIEVLMVLPPDHKETKAFANPGPIREAAYDLLKQRGAPMDRGEILRQLTSKGIIVGGPTPQQNLSAHLSNDPRIEVIGDGLWGLAEWRNARVAHGVAQSQ